MAKVFINIYLVRIGPARSVDYKQGTGMDLIAPAPTVDPVTQVSYNIMLAMYK
jgi:hypothetical protein